MRQHGWLALACVLAGATVTAAQEKPTLPAGTVARLGMTRLRVPAGILDTAFSPDGRTFVITFHVEKAEQPNVLLFDVATGLARKRLDIHDAYRIAMARHKPLMVLDTTKGFEVWNLATEKLVKQWLPPVQGWSTTALAISPDGTEVVAAASQRGKAVVWRWDVATGQALPARYPTTTQINALSFSTDGSKLLTASEDTVAVVKEKITTIPGNIIAWDTKTGKQLAELGDLSRNVVFAPDGSRFVRGMRGQGVEIIDIATGKRLAAFADPYGQFAFTPDSKRLVIVSGGAVRLWDIAANKEVRPFEGAWGNIIRPRFSADGSLLAVVQYDASANYVQFWDVATGKRLRFETGHPGEVGGLAYSPDGRHLATFSENTLLIFDTKTGTELQRWIGHKEPISQIAFAPDGKLLASAAYGGTVALWDPATAKQRHRLSGKAYGRALAFARDGATLFAASSNHSLQSWDVGTGVRQRSYELPQMIIPAISGTGQLLAYLAPEFDGTQYRWGTSLHFLNLQTGKRLSSLNLQRDPSAADDDFASSAASLAFAFSADSKLLATNDSLKMYDHAIRVWETVSRREILRVASLPNSTRLLAISPDGRILAHGLDSKFTWGGHGTDDTVLLRDISSGQSIALKGKDADILLKQHRPIRGHFGRITCLAFSPDSKYLATGGSDRVVYIWRVADFFKRSLVPEVKGDIAALWPALADANAGKAYQAIAQLERQPKETLALLRKHLQPVPTADAKVIAQHLRDLSSNKYTVRQQASAALAKTGEQATHLLRAALKNANLEVTRRLESLLEKLERRVEEPSELRVYRCLVLLERLGTSEARKLLGELAQGAPAAWLTMEARYSLKRFVGP